MSSSRNSAASLTYSGRPVERSSSTSTPSPRSTRASTTCEPMKPAPPVTRTFTGEQCRPTLHGAVTRHRCGPPTSALLDRLEQAVVGGAGPAGGRRAVPPAPPGPCGRGSPVAGPPVLPRPAGERWRGPRATTRAGAHGRSQPAAEPASVRAAQTGRAQRPPGGGAAPGSAPAAVPPAPKPARLPVRPHSAPLATPLL